jgi:hypothetical protein
MERAKPGPVNRRRLWQDPIVVVCWGAPTLLLVLLAGYLAREHSQGRFDEQVVALNDWAKAVDYPGNAEDALVRYEAVLSFAGGRRPVSLASSSALDYASERRKALRHSLGVEACPEKARADHPGP